RHSTSALLAGSIMPQLCRRARNSRRSRGYQASVLTASRKEEESEPTQHQGHHTWFGNNLGDAKITKLGTKPVAAIRFEEDVVPLPERGGVGVADDQCVLVV